MTPVTTPRRRRPALAAAMAFLALTFSAASPGVQAQTLLQAWQNAALPADAPVGAPQAAQALHAVQVNPQAAAEAEKGALARFIAAEYKTSTTLAARIVNAAYDAASRYSISPSLVLAIISRESTFNPRATSGYGAQGLMQVVPRFHMDKVQDVRAATPAEASLFHPETNIAVGTRILAEYMEAESSLPRALVKYSGKAYRYIEKVMRERDAFERVRLEADEDGQV